MSLRGSSAVEKRRKPPPVAKVRPATLLGDWALFFLQSDPEAKRTIADRQLRRSGKSISADQ
jgi:hypothetical protein